MFFYIGALVPSYLILRLCLYICSKCRKQPNRGGQIVLMGVISLGLSTVIAGFGLQHEASNPRFVEAFAQYLAPAITVTLFELVRTRS